MPAAAKASAAPAKAAPSCERKTALVPEAVRTTPVRPVPMARRGRTAPCACGGHCPRCQRTGDNSASAAKPTAAPARPPSAKTAAVKGAVTKGAATKSAASAKTSPTAKPARQAPRPPKKSKPVLPVLENSSLEQEAVTVAEKIISLAMPPAPPAPPPTPPDPNSASRSHHALLASQLAPPRFLFGLSSQLEPHQRPVDRAHRPGAPPASGKFPALHATPLPFSGLGLGETIATPWRSWFEERFQTDFSAVRIYRGSAASQLAESYDARAFTYGNHVVLGAAAPSLDSAPGRLLLAHELAHTLQQAGSAAHRVSRAPVRVQSFANAPAVQCWDLPSLPTWEQTVNAAESAGDAVVSAPGRVYDAAVETGQAVVETGREVLEYGLDQFLEFLEERFPTFIEFLRSDPVEFLKDLFTEALDSFLGGLVGRIRREGLVETLTAVFGGAVESVQQMIADIARGDCSSLFGAIQGLIDFADTLFGPELRAIRDFASDVGDVFGDLWARFGAPALAAISDFAGDVWDSIQETATEFWNATAEVREWFTDVWNSFKEAFGIVWDSGAGVIDWLIDKATEAWDAIAEALGPALIPLGILAALALQFTPLGPILNIYIIYRASTGAISWIYDNWGAIENVFVEARQYLHDTVLPQIMESVQTLSNALGTAASWLSDILSSIASTVADLLTAIGLGPVVTAFSDLVTWLSEQMDALAQWASEAFTALVTDVRQALQAIYDYTRPIWGLVAAILLFPSFPFLLPVVLAGWAWRLTPDCLKEPIIDWVIGIMIGAVRALPEFSNFGEAWPTARRQILETLSTIQTLPMEQKIAATDRVAKMMTLEDVEWIGNLIAAAIEMPSHFIGQFEEELIGMNLTEPLPFEPRPGATPSATTDLLSSITSGGANPDLNVLLQSTLSASDIAVDSVATLDLSAAILSSLPEGETFFGERTDDFASIDRVRRELLEASGGEGEVAPTDAGTGLPDTAGMTPDEATEARLQAMIDQPMADECPGREAPPVASAETIPPELQIGPLSQAQRGRFMMAQMGKGLRKWWECNREWLLPTIFVVVCALIGLEILTEGAITAALPALMELVTALFIGIAVARSAYYMGEYVMLAAPGNISGGARSLARSFAVAAVELIFALMFNLGSVIKSLRGGLRAALRDAAAATRSFGRTTVKAAQTLGRVTVRGLTTAGRNIRRIPGIILREGRLIFEGVGSGLGRGVRSLRELGERLWQRCRFRGFSLERHGRHVQLWGHFNPKVLLADGTIEDVTFAGSKERPLVGSLVDVVGRRRSGILVGIRDTDASSFVRYLETLSDAERRALFRRLEGLGDEARRLEIIGIGQTAENARLLRQSMTGTGTRAGRGTAGGGNAAHHIVPSTHGYASADEARRLLESAGIDINHGLNGVFTPPDIHSFLHTHAYMDAVADALRPIANLPTRAARRAAATSILDNLAQKILNRHFTP